MSSLPSTLSTFPLKPGLNLGRLDDPDLQQAMGSVLDGIPPHHGAFYLTVAYPMGGNGAAVYGALGERISDGWSIKAVGRVDIDGSHPEGEIVLQGSW